MSKPKIRHPLIVNKQDNQLVTQDIEIKKNKLQENSMSKFR